MFKESTEKLVGNDAFEGYAIDLIAEIAKILSKLIHMKYWLLWANLNISSEFNYTFKWVDDGAYGYKNKETGEWNGLMGELLSQVSVSGVWETMIGFIIPLCVDGKSK